MATCQLMRPAKLVRELHARRSGWGGGGSRRPGGQAQVEAEEVKQVLAEDIATRQQSLFFMKKFTALSISNICFLRNIFPDEAFAGARLLVGDGRVGSG